MNLLISGKKYYKNILIKLKNTYSIISISSLIYIDNKHNYNIKNSFYKIYSFSNNISLEYINYILEKIFPYDIWLIIIKNYLTYDVSFSGITSKYQYNTIKINSYIKYSESYNKYTELIEYPTTIIHKDNIILTNLSNNICINFINLINKLKYFDVDEIFQINDIDYCYIYKITNKVSKGWGIKYNIN